MCIYIHSYISCVIYHVLYLHTCYVLHAHVNIIISLSKLWRRRRKYVLNQKSQNPPPVHQALQKVHLKAKLKMKEAGEESVKEELKQNNQENGERKRGKKRIQDASEPQTKDGDYFLKFKNFRGI